MAESKEELKILLMKVKEESEKAGLQLGIQNMKIMASGPITSWQIDGETMETVIDFIFLGSKITADGDCSHEMERCLVFGRKVMTNLDSILKSRDITLPTNIYIVKAMVFPIVVYRCKSYTIKKGWWWDLASRSCLILATPWTVACQVPLSMGFSRQEYWRGLPFLSSGDLPDPGIKPRSPALQAN